jgi:hypothetical protein
MSKKRIIHIPKKQELEFLALRALILDRTPYVVSENRASQLISGEHPEMKQCGTQLVILVRSNGQKENRRMLVLKPIRRRQVFSGLVLKGLPVVIQSRSNFRRGRGKRVRGGDWRANPYEHLLTCGRLNLLDDQFKVQRYRTTDGKDIAVPTNGIADEIKGRSILYFPHEGRRTTVSATKESR